MSVKNVSTTEIKNQVKLEIQIEKAVFEAAVDRVYKRSAKNITVPGFRKGKAPRGIVEKMYGKGVFYEDAINDLLPDELEKAIAEKSLKVVSRPEVEIEDINDEGVLLTVLYFVKPEVEVKSYKGLEAEKIVAPVTDEDVEHEIFHALERAARMVEVDRACEMGDFATIDYLGSVDGVNFDGGKAEDHKLEIGSGSFIPGFEEQLVGHKVGEKFDINVKFPEEYHAEELKGKDAVFAINLKKLEKKELPALDDEFVKDVSEFDTLDEYKADIKANIEKRNENAANSTFEAQLSEALIANLEADIPASMFELETERMLEDYSYRMQSQGISLDMYMKYTGMTLDSFKEQFKPQAESRVKFQLALEKIVELENITVSDEDVEAEFTKMAEAYKISVDDVKKSVPADAVREDLIRTRAFDFVKDNAKVLATAKKASAKKTTTKKADEGEKASAKKTTTTKKADGEKAGAKKTTTTKKADGEKASAKKTTTTKKADEGEKASAKKTTTTKKADGEKASAKKTTTTKKATTTKKTEK